MTITDPGAPDLATLFELQRASMTRLAHVITGSNAVAQDVVQDAFIRLSNARNVREPAAYLRVIVVNLSRTVARKAARPLPTVRSHAPTGEPDIDELWAYVQRLPEKYRTALALRFYADMSEAQMAEHLGCRPGTVKTLVSRGLDLLRKELP